VWAFPLLVRRQGSRVCMPPCFLWPVGCSRGTAQNRTGAAWPAGVSPATPQPLTRGAGMACGWIVIVMRGERERERETPRQTAFNSSVVVKGIERTNGGGDGRVDPLKSAPSPRLPFNCLSNDDSCFFRYWICHSLSVYSLYI
jgi:hypothetical protein